MKGKSNLIVNKLDMSSFKVICFHRHISVLLFSLLSLDPSVLSPALRSQQSAIQAAGSTLVSHCSSEMTPRHVVVSLLRALRHVRTEVGHHVCFLYTMLVFLSQK